MNARVIPTGVHGVLDYLASGANLAFTHQRDAAGEDDDPSPVRGVDAEKGLARLCHLADLSGGETPAGRGEGLVYGDVDARHPGPVHPLEG